MQSVESNAFLPGMAIASHCKRNHIAPFFPKKKLHRNTQKTAAQN